MKNLFIYSVTFILAAIMISLAACEQDDLSNIQIIEKSFDNEGDYIFENPDWVLIQEDYENENGSVGSLYENENNSIETKFVIRQVSDADKNKFTGTYKKILDGVLVVGEVCKVPKKNCYTTIITDGDGNPMGVKITVKEDK